MSVPTPVRRDGSAAGRTIRGAHAIHAAPFSATPSVRPLVGAAILVAYAIPAVVAYWHAWSGGPAGTAVAGGAGDAAQYEWFLAWVPWALGHGHDVLSTAWVNWPVGVDVPANPSVLLLGLIGAPVTILFGPVATLNLWMTLAFPLSAGAGYLLARRFTAWRPAAFAAGLAYGFSPYVVVQGSYHLNLAFVPLPPLILCCLHELLVRQERPPLRTGFALGVLVVAQFFISSEVLATTAMFSVLAVVVLALRFPGRVAGRVAPVLAGLAVAVIVIAVVLAYPLDVLFRAPAHISGAIPGFNLYHSSLVAPLLPTSAMHFGTAHLKAMGDLIGGNSTENGTYLGAPLIALAVVAALAVRRPAARLAGLMALIAYVLSLGTSLDIGMVRFASDDGRIPLPAAVLAKLPLLGQAFPERYALYVALFVAIVLAVALDALHARLARRRTGWRLGAPAAVAAVCLLPLVPAWPYNDISAVEVPAFFTGAGARTLPAGGVTLVYPIATDTNSAAQLWQADASFRFLMPGGYFVVPMPGGGSQYNTVTPVSTALSAVLDGPAPARTAALRSSLRAELASWRVGSVAAQPVGHDPIGFLTWLIGRPPDARTGGMDVWYGLRWR